VDSVLLIAEDDPLVARALDLYFRRHVSVAITTSLAEAEELLDRPSAWCGIIVDVSLPDGNGLDALEKFRTVNAHAPALVLSGHWSPDLINRAARSLAIYSVKPALPVNLASFLRQLETYDAGLRHQIDAIIEQYAHTRGLTQSERRLLSYAARGTSRKALADELGIAENTVKSHARSLLRKCDNAEQIGDVVREIWRRASAH
jgi:DNA-binding NarL/FixJ family response regulator